MKEIATQVYPFEVKGYCDCGGLLESTGQGMSDNWTTYWEHKCANCGKVEQLENVYPYIIHKRLEQ